MDGLSASLDLREDISKKYFGNESRDNFFSRYKWLDRQLQITQNGPNHHTGELYFEDNLKQSYDKSTPKFVNDYAFAPKRPKNCYSDENTSSEEEEEVEYFTYPAYYLTEAQLLAEKEKERLRIEEEMYALVDTNTLRTGITTVANTLDLGFESVQGDVSQIDEENGSLGLHEEEEEENGFRHLNKQLNTTINSSNNRFTVNIQNIRPLSGIGKRPVSGKKMNSRPVSASAIHTSKSVPALKPLTFTNKSKSEILNNLAIPNSPRTGYLVKCANNNVLPRASLVLRKLFTKELNLQHQGMGDDMAMILADSIKTMPYIESINISDNKLSCDGLCAIFDAISDNPNLLSLDIAGISLITCVILYTAHNLL